MFDSCLPPCLVSHLSEQTSAKGISTPLRGDHHAQLREIMRAPLRPLTWSHGDAKASAL